MKTLHSATSALGILAILLATSAFSQDEFGEVQQVIEIQGDVPEGGTFFIPEIGNADTVDVISNGDGVMVMSASTSFGDAPPFLSGDGISFGNSDRTDSGLMSLLQDKSIREEIDLVDAQYEKMRKFNESKSKNAKKLFQNLFKDGKIDATAIKEMMEKSQKEASKQLEEMLLPHQVARLRQVSRQVQMQSRGTAETLTSSKFAEELGLSEEEKSELRKKAEEIGKRVKAEIAKLKLDARRELIGTLPSEKQEKLKEMIGDDFAYERPDMKSRLREIRKKAEEQANKIKASRKSS